MNIILSRHGNTFGPQDPVVWTGATNDLPLVEKGIAQAEKFAQVLIAQEIRPAAVYCSPLQRTRSYAEVIIQKLALPFQPMVDSRIHEIDYGEWTGKTQEEVKELFGESVLKDWDEKSKWPQLGAWGGSPAQLIDEVQSFMKDLVQRHQKNDTLIVVTSNGRLRYFLTLVDGEFERRCKENSFKVKTGNLCQVLFRNGVFLIPQWNIEPKISVSMMESNS